MKYKHKNNGGWIGVDLDGTLAEYTGWKGSAHIGKPLQPMVDRVKAWMAHGFSFRIFTARASHVGEELHEDFDYDESISSIKAWCRKVFGFSLPVTAEKDLYMMELWDDRCVQVEYNTGKVLELVSDGN